MNLLMNKQNSKHQEVDKINDSPHYLAHEEEPVDFYRKYKDNDFIPMKGGRNLQNLFDDSDVKDHYWFNIAKKYFSRF